jgi:hypothetical protein
MQPKPPIFLIEGLDVGVFPSIEDALGSIEPIDVRECSAYDSEGRQLKLGVAETGGFLGILFWGNQHVVLDAVDPDPSHATALANSLIQFLEYLSVEEKWLSSAPLSELVRKTVEVTAGH